jgi:hypothetical protein
MSFAMCQWAACGRLAAVMEDGYYHCARHLRDHRDQRDHVTRDTPLRELLPALHAQGLTDAQVVAQTGYDASYVRNLRCQLGLAANVPVPDGCGTRSAAERHKAKGEPVCAACKAAERIYYRDRARNRRAKAKAA